MATINAVNNGLSGQTGTGAFVGAISPSLTTPVLGTPISANLTNATGLPISTGVSGLAANVATFLGTPSSANLAAAITDETGSGALVFATSPSLVTPALGTPSSVVLTNGTGLPISSGVSGLGSGVATALGTSVNGTGAISLTTSPSFVTPVLGTPTSATLTNATGLPISTGVSGLGSGIATFLATPSSANLASAITDETGSGALVFATSPSLTTPALGTPSAVVLTNGTGLPIGSGVSGLASGVATFLGTPTSANLASAVTDETGSGALVFATSPALVTPNLGTPSAAIMTNATGLPVSSGISGLGSGVATFLATPSSANLASAVIDETGSGALVFATSPTLITPALGTPASGVLTNATGLPVSTGISGLGTGIDTFLATPSSANLASAITDETGSGALVFGTSPTLATPSFGSTNGTAKDSQPIQLSKWSGTGDAKSNNTTTPTTMLPTGVGSLTYAANTTIVGTIIRITAWWETTTFSGGGSLTISLYIDGTSRQSLTVPAATTTIGRAEFDLTIRSIGAVGIAGQLLMASQAIVSARTSTASVWATNSSHTIDVRSTWSTASGSNNIETFSSVITSHYQN